MQNKDPAATRVKPMPIQVLHHAQSLVDNRDRTVQTYLDAAYVGFFFMLRSGEYLQTKGNRPLLLRNVTFRNKHQAFQAATCTMKELDAADYGAITFDNQKNHEKGETIAHHKTGHSIACPVEALKRLVRHLRQNNAPLDTPLYSYYSNGKPKVIKSTEVTAILRASVAALPSLCYEQADVSARSLQAGGAMALLLAGIDKNRIQLVGRWRSDAIFRYLHAQALPFVKPLSAKMLEHGVYTLIPGGITPQQAEALLAQVVPEPDQTYYLELSPEEDEPDPAAE